MPATYLDLYVDQGCDFSYMLNVENPDGTFVNLTSYSYTGQVKMSQYANTQLVNANLFCTVTNVSNGQLNIALDAANTANLAAGKYFYDVLQRAPNNQTIKFMTGLFIVNPTITEINPANEGIPAL